MKYRYITNVVTRHSGMLCIFCKDYEQAHSNVRQYSKLLGKDQQVISFDSVSALPNVLLMSEIIAVSVQDMELSRDIQLEEMKEHTQLHKDIDCGYGENQDTEDWR